MTPFFPSTGNPRGTKPEEASERALEAYGHFAAAEVSSDCALEAYGQVAAAAIPQRSGAMIEERRIVKESVAKLAAAVYPKIRGEAL